MEFQPLHVTTLAPAQRLASELFPWEDEHQIALPAALEPEGHVSFYADRRLRSVRCWTANEQRTGLLRGIASLYEYRAQPDEAWLAWFGLVPEVRGRGAGRRMLDWLIYRMEEEGRRTLRLWTTDEPEYAAAVQLYLRRGFTAEDHPSLPDDEWRTMVFSLGLNGQRPMPWSSVLDRGELCGRQAAHAACLAA